MLVSRLTGLAAGIGVGAEHGWRNAQASVLAPTGTIGFMMDCDTTGIEPDFSLVKFKKLVGGGSMQIVNQVDPAGSAPSRVHRGDHRGDHRVHRRARARHRRPGAEAGALPVFDCAMGERAITPMGHVRMMAACQPFLSGAISKTVNMPESATVDEVEEIYFQSWKFGIKALAIYRDNCKVGQPLSDAKAKKVSARSRPSRWSTGRSASGCPRPARVGRSPSRSAGQRAT